MIRKVAMFFEARLLEAVKSSSEVRANLLQLQQELSMVTLFGFTGVAEFDACKKNPIGKLYCGTHGESKEVQDVFRKAKRVEAYFSLPPSPDGNSLAVRLELKVFRSGSREPHWTMGALALKGTPLGAHRLLLP